MQVFGETNITLRPAPCPENNLAGISYAVVSDVYDNLSGTFHASILMTDKGSKQGLFVRKRSWAAALPEILRT